MPGYCRAAVALLFKPRSGERMRPTAQAWELVVMSEAGGAKGLRTLDLLTLSRVPPQTHPEIAIAADSRRIPRSTSASRSDAAVIHSKSADSAILFNSEAMSVLRTSPGAPASIDARSRNSE